MKKYIYLFLSTLLIITVTILSGYAVNGNTAEVEVFSLETKNMDNTITSSGKLQYRSGKSVKANEMGIIKDIYVKNGDEIKKGDVLFSYYQAEIASQYADLQNLISIQSYIDTMLSLTLSLGIVFEVPVVCWLLAQTGLLKPRMMSRYRRHAVVVILIVAAIITPTQDVFTLLIVSLPIWLLYEASIWVVRLQTKP